MEPLVDPRASDADLTAKARIRNAALDLYSRDGEDRVSMRAVAAAAGVTVGLVQHHFKTKAGIRDAVEQLVIDYFATAIAGAASTGSPAEVASARDEAVGRMLEANPTVVNYIRRALLDPGPRGRLLERLTDLTYAEITKLRDSGVASTKKRDSVQVIEVLVRQLGQLFLAPMINTMWEQLAGPDAPVEDRPVLVVGMEDPDPAS
ncbi:TetR family transcriptional regulator [Rhodococcus sp. ACS1]|uniref:TetR/AcrR family transcriptional regulator n=1 Tax=Rhodococcus sp. ACS1 TaxID=2028570 RepID=UPI000BB11B56|nr:TetR family transcriptional regulator [Rhodococcus sp. ACS1]PBC47805.1 TetR family transcriptional regulator [Rhodococcus sp. ACS1]